MPVKGRAPRKPQTGSGFIQLDPELVSDGSVSCMCQVQGFPGTIRSSPGPGLERYHLNNQ